MEAEGWKRNKAEEAKRGVGQGMKGADSGNGRKEVLLHWRRLATVGSGFVGKLLPVRSKDAAQHTLYNAVSSQSQCPGSSKVGQALTSMWTIINWLITVSQIIMSNVSIGTSPAARLHYFAHAFTNEGGCYPKETERMCHKTHSLKVHYGYWALIVNLSACFLHYLNDEIIHTSAFCSLHKGNSNRSFCETSPMSC